MRERKRETSVRCGGRQVSGCARFTLAFANGDILRRKGERVSSLLGMKKSEEEREKKRSAREYFAPKKRVTRRVIPLLLVAPGARETRREDIQKSAGREHTHLRWAEQRYITRAPRDTSPAGSLPLSSVSPSAGLPTSLFLSLFQSALSMFPRGWIAARGYVRNCGTKSAEELTVHRDGHKTLLIPIDFDSRKLTRSI